MMKDINWLLKELKTYFNEESTGHDYWHAERVWKTALTIAKEEKADLKIVEAAALLHDVADWKMDESKRVVGEQKLSFWMNELGYTVSEQESIRLIIDNMSYKGGTNNRKVLSLEGQVVQDADRLDALGAIGIARAFAYGGSKGRPLHNPEMDPTEFDDFEAYKKHKGATVHHFYEKLFKLKALMNTESGKRLAKSRDTFMHEFIDRFYSEWEGEI